MKLLVDGQLLKLDQDTKIRLQLKSPLFADEQPGSLSYQFTVPVSPENVLIFGFTHLPGSRTDRRKEYPVELQVGAFRLVGRLQARKATMKVYECDLTIPAANISAQVWKRSLRQFNFGTVTYQTFPISLMLYSAQLPDFGGSQFSTTVKLLKGNTTLFSYTYPGVTQSLIGDYLPRPFWSDFARRIMDAVGNTPALSGFTAQGTDTGFAVYVPSAGQYKISYEVRLGDRSNNRVTTIELNPASSRLINQVENGKNLMQTDERYCMPMIKNDAWYPSDQAKSWNGFINAVTQANTDSLGGHSLNIESGTRYSLSPAIYMGWAIRKTCELLGYSVKDQVFTEPELQKLILWTNRSLDQLIPNTVATWNEYASSWKIGDHLPNLTMKDWVNKFGQNLFFRPIFYPSRRECVLVFLRDVINAKKVVDWTSKLQKSREIDTADLSPVQALFSLDSGDELSKKETPLFAPVPTDAIVDAQQDILYQKLEFPFSPPVMEKKTVAVNTQDPDSPYYSRNWQQGTKEIAITPMVKQKGISVFFDQTSVTQSPGRLMFYVPDLKIPNPLAPPRGGDDYPAYRIATADIQTENYSLELGGAKGTIETFGKDWMNFLSKPQSQKYLANLNSIDLQNFAWEQKYYLNGLQYLVEMIDVTFSQKGIEGSTELTCRRVPSQIQNTKNTKKTGV